MTMVAAWIRADTGVGPSMASGSQLNSGIWADLPVAASEEQQHGGGGRPAGQQVPVGEDRQVVERADLGEDEEHGQQEADVADPVVDEGLLAGRGGRVPLEPERDQPVGADPDPLPARRR